MENENLTLLRSLEEDEARARRRGVLTAWALVGLAVVVLGVMIVTGSSRLAAIRAQTTAESDSLRVMRAERARLAAEVADLEGRLAAEYQAPLGLDSAVVAPDTQSVRPPGPDSALIVMSTPDGDTGEVSLPARVYLQIVAAGDRTYARSVGRRLAAEGFQVLGVEYVRNAPRLRTTELRYYKKADEPDAQRLLEALRAAGEPDARLVYLGLENSTRVRPRHYEVWFAAGAGQGARRPVTP